MTIPKETLNAPPLLHPPLLSNALTPPTTGTNRLALKPAGAPRIMSAMCLRFTFALMPPRGNGLQALLGPRPNLENIRP